MLRSYILTSFRNLVRNKAYTAINIIGLGLGLAIFLLLAQYVAHESGANRFNPRYDRLYRVQVQNKEGKADYHLPPGYAPQLQAAFPAIEQALRFAEDIGSGTIERADAPGAEALRGSRILYADSGFLNAFAFPVTSGNASLQEPGTLALSEATSQNLFGKEDPIGKTVVVSNQFGRHPYRVAAVYAQPEPSDIRADLVLSLKTLESAAGRNGNDWADPSGLGAGYSNIYLQLRPGSKGAALAGEITRWAHSVNPESKDDQVFLQPMSELHLAPSFSYPFHTYGSLKAISVFGAIAVLILLIAWVNYINLSVAQSLKRSREIGVRKVLGASRGQLVRYYLTETALLTIGGLVLALFLTQAVQPLFNAFVEKELSLKQLAGSWVLLVVAGLTLLGALLAGSYSGLVLTSARAAQALRNKARFTGRGLSLGKGMLVFQFFISSLLLIGTLVIYRQLGYMREKDLGMKLGQLLVLSGPAQVSAEQKPQAQAFKQALAALPFVEQLSASNNVPGVGFNFTANGITGTAPQKDDDQKPYNMFIADAQFFSTYGIRLLQGVPFRATDAESGWGKSRKVILNESAARSLGYRPDEAVGRKLLWGEPYEIIGIVPDYHHVSLKEPITPAIYLAATASGYFTLRLRTEGLTEKLATLKQLYRQYFPGQPFDYFFADERFNRQYQSDEQLGRVFVAAAGATIFIASIGLLGLVAFSTRQRMKEIGIRKILGASVGQILSLTSKDYLKLVALAFLLAAPVGWWAATTWLQDFAYKTAVSWWIFLAAGAFALLLALATVGLMAMRAASGSQVRNLRSE